MDRTHDMIVARFAIEDTLFRYAEAIDEGRLEDLRSLLAECRLALPDGLELAGGPAIVEHYRSLIRFYDADQLPAEYQRGRTNPRTRHVVTNVLCEFDNAITGADVRSVFTVTQNLARSTQVIASGRYLDRFERGIGGWRLVRRSIVIDHAGDMSRHTR